MSNTKSSAMGGVSIATAIVAVLGVSVLIFYPNLVSGIWKFLAWSVTAAAATTTGVIRHLENKKVELAEKKRLDAIRRKRREQSQKERAAQLQRVQKAQERAERKEVKRTKKQMAIKAEIVAEAETTWAEKEKYAQQQEILAREIIASTNDMNIRTVAGGVAIEWNEAAALAKWAAQEMIMYSRRPPVTTKARDEAQDAIIEAENIKAAGNILTQDQGLELKKLKDKAREEAKIEEDRLDSIRYFVEGAERKWNVATLRADRLQQELNVLLKRSPLH